MKNTLLILVALFIAGEVSATSPMRRDPNFFQCFVGDSKDVAVGIDVKNDIAGYFDGDRTALMKRVQCESNGPSKAMTYCFSGNASGGKGYLQLNFNRSSRKMSLTLIKPNRTKTQIGTGDCPNSVRWDILPE